MSRRKRGYYLLVAIIVIAMSCSSILISPVAIGKTLKFGYVLHLPIPFTSYIQKGAEDAGRDFGVEVEVVCPPKYNPQTAIALFEGFVTKRVDGIVVIAYPDTTWVVPINEAIDLGVPVLTANCDSPKSKRIAWVGQDEYNSGRILARELLKRLKGKSGKIILGTCAPDASVIIDRANGFMEVMAEHPDFEVLGPYNVTAEMTANYAAWENLISANPDLLAAVGLCALDNPNFALLKKKTGKEFICAGYDLVIDTLKAIKEGSVSFTLGQHPYLQGYLPIRALAEHYQQGKPIPAGWIKCPTEIVDASSDLDTLIRRQSDMDFMTEWYKKFIPEHYPELKGEPSAIHPAHPWRGK